MSYSISYPQAYSVVQSLQRAANCISGTPAEQGNIVSNVLAWIAPPVLQYVEFPLTDGVASYNSSSHGLGRSPIFFRPVIHCISPAALNPLTGSSVSLPVGVEIGVNLFVNFATFYMQFGCGYDSVNVYGNYSGQPATAPFLVWNGTRGHLQSYSNFTFRLYYR